MQSQRECALCTRRAMASWAPVATGRWTSVYLDPRGAVPGLCIVVWTRDHVSEPTELSSEGAHGYWQELLDVGRALQRVFHPVNINYLTMGNSVPHLHTLVVPRHRDDPFPGRPIPWSALFSSTQVDDFAEDRAASIRASLAWT